MIDKIQYENQIAYALPSVKNNNKIENRMVVNQHTRQPLSVQAWQQSTYEEPRIEIKTKKWDEIEVLLNQDEQELAKLYQKGYLVETQLEHELKGNTHSSYTYTQTSTTKEKVERVKKQEDSMYLYAMTTGEELTLNNLYKATFTGANKKTNNTYSTSEITSLLRMNQVEDTKGNRQAVTKLLGLGLDVNTEQVVKYQNIQDVIEGMSYDEEMPNKEFDFGNLKINEWIENPEKAYEERVLIKEDKVLYVEKEIADIVDELSQVDDQVIEGVMESADEVTIGNLRESLLKNTKRVLDGKHATQQSVEKINRESMSVGQAISPHEPSKTDAIEQVKVQIKEIRARLNVETAQKLSEKMPLESSELSKVAEALRQIEDRAVERVMDKVNLEPTKANKEQLHKLLQATQAINKHPVQAIAVQITTNEQATVEEIHQHIQAYEELGTVAESRFGETSKKVEAQIENFLKQYSLPSDQKTIQCAKALITNGLDLTMENLEGVRPMLEKMTIVLEEMTPYRAASFIKEGLNPYKASINHLVQWIGEERLPEMKESIASAIVALEDKGKINEVQKQSLMGLYRILHGTQVNREQVVGYLFKNELPLTIEHLEEAVKYVDKGSLIEQTIDDEFGEIDRIKYTQPTAKQMIEEVKSDIKKLVDLSKLLEQEKIPVTSEKLQKLTQLNSMVYPFIKQTLKRELGKFEGVDVLPQTLQDKITRIKEMKPEVVEMMIKQDIPITIANLAVMDEMLKEPSKYKGLLDQSKLVDEKFPQTFEQLEQELEALRQEVVENKEEAMQQGDFIGYKNYKQLEEMVEVQKHLTQKSGIYHIPFVIDGEMRHIDLYVNERHKKSNSMTSDEGLNVVMSYETKGLGQIMAYMNIKDTQINYKVSTNTKQTTSVLEKEKQILEETLKRIGYGIQHSEYVSSKAVSVVEVAQHTTLRKEGTFEVQV